MPNTNTLEYNRVALRHAIGDPSVDTKIITERHIQEDGLEQAILTAAGKLPADVDVLMNAVVAGQEPSLLHLLALTVPNISKEVIIIDFLLSDDADPERTPEQKHFILHEYCHRIPDLDYEYLVGEFIEGAHYDLLTTMAIALIPDDRSRDWAYETILQKAPHFENLAGIQLATPNAVSDEHKAAIRSYLLDDDLKAFADRKFALLREDTPSLMHIMECLNCKALNEYMAALMANAEQEALESLEVE